MYFVFVPFLSGLSMNLSKLLQGRLEVCAEDPGVFQLYKSDDEKKNVEKDINYSDPRLKTQWKNTCIHSCILFRQ